MVKLNMDERKNSMDSYSLHKEQNVFCLVPHLRSSESFQVQIIKENFFVADFDMHLRYFSVSCCVFI